MPDTAAGLPIAPLPSVVPSLCNPFPLQPLPSATPSLRNPPANCGPFRLSPLFLLAVEGGRQGRERGTTVCFTRDRLRRAAAVGSVWRKGGMTGGRRLPGLQGGLVRMAGGDCRGCKVGWSHGGRQLPGLQGEAGRMAGGGCRGCKVRLVAWRAVFVGSARENPGRAGRRTRLRITGRHRVTVRSSHGGLRLPGLRGGIRVGRRPSDPLEDQRRHRVTARSSHGGRPGGESSATRCAVDIFLLILPS